MLTVPTESLFEDVTNAPVPAVSKIVNETPYYIYAKNLGDAEAQVVDTTVSFLSIAANAPTDDSYEATIWVNGVAKGRLVFCAYGTLDIAMSRTSTTVTLANTNNLETLIVGQFIQVGLELMGIVSIATNVITVIRGVLDTVPVSHLVGEDCFAWEGLNGANGVQYFLTENLSVKITPITPQGELSFAAATADSITIIGRMHLPYPPGNLKLNTITFPSLISVTDIIVTWATRNRFTQTIGLVDYYSGSLTSEPGVTYTGELRRIDTNGLLLSFDGVTGTTTTLITMINVPFITLTNSGTLATVTTSAAHGLVTGRKIVIISAADAAFNGTFVITVLNSTSFTYTMSTTPTLGSSGAIIKASLYAGNVKFTVWSVNANGNSFQRIEHTFTLE